MYNRFTEKYDVKGITRMKRLISLLLMLSIVLAALTLIACANKRNNDHQDENTTGVDFDSLDYGGSTIRFVYAESENDRFTARSISVDEDNGNDVDARIMERNAYVEKTLGVKIESIQGSRAINGLKDAIGSQLAASSGSYDVIAGYQYYDIGFALEGWLADMNTLNETYGVNGYLNFDNPHWSQYYNENLLVGNRRYWATGDLALRYIGGMYVTYVNERIYKNELYETYGDIYDIAFRGDWTLDLLTEMSRLCYKDTGSTNDELDIDDQLGFIYEAIDPIDGLAFGAQVPFSTKYSDGSIRITLNSDRTLTFINKLSELLHGTGSYHVTSGNESRECLQQFESGNVAFTFGHIKHAENYLTEMTDGYYMLPTPKLDYSQEEYVSGVHDGCTIFGIAADSPNIEAAANTLELMAAESLRIVTPVYYESAVKYKYTRDDDSARVIDLIRGHVETDFAAVWSSQLGNIAHFFRNNNTTTNISSVLKRSTTEYKNQLEILLKKFDDLQKD